MIRILLIITFIFACFGQFSLANEKELNINELQNKLEGIKRLDILKHRGFTTRRYILGPNDMISITSTCTPQINHEKLKIHPDGTVFISLIGEVQASGLSIQEFHTKLEQKYLTYLKNPQISVKLVRSRPFIVYITGAVMNPGSYEINTDIGSATYLNHKKPEVQLERKTPLLTNVLVAAGGISYDADLENIEITNRNEGSKFTINLLNLLEKGDSTEDIYLMTGDTVHVPRLSTPLALKSKKYKKYASSTFSPAYVPVKVVGYVNNPGLIKLEPAQSLNLNSAISMAGGYLNDAAYAPKEVFINRVDENGRFIRMKANPMRTDLMLMPNDVVYVPEKTRPLIGKGFDYTGRLISPIGVFANAFNNWALIFDPTRLYK